MKVTKKTHYSQLYNGGLKSMFGKYQYIYESDKGQISLLKLINYFRDGHDLWEIYCLEGDLFDDVERFNTKKEAEERIKDLLGDEGGG